MHHISARLACAHNVKRVRVCVCACVRVCVCARLRVCARDAAHKHAVRSPGPVPGVQSGSSVDPVWSSSSSML